MNKKNNDLSLPFRRAGGIIYNITTKVEATIANAWLQWLLDEHIPEILATKCFTGYKVVRLLEVDDSEGPTYAVQYHAESKADYNRYMEKHAAIMRQKTFDRWGQQFIAFNSIMEVVK